MSQLILLLGAFVADEQVLYCVRQEVILSQAHELRRQGHGMKVPSGEPDAPLKCRKPSPARAGVTDENINRVRLWMTVEEVEAILGPPAYPYEDCSRELTMLSGYWCGNGKHVFVYFVVSGDGWRVFEPARSVSPDDESLQPRP